MVMVLAVSAAPSSAHIVLQSVEAIMAQIKNIFKQSPTYLIFSNMISQSTYL